MFIGHIPEVGKQALAGVGVTTPVILAISAFATLVSMGDVAVGAVTNIAQDALLINGFGIR